MRVKFNKTEKAAGLFVLVAILAMLGGLIGVSIKNGWFSSKVKFVAYVDSADGIHAGTEVQIAGIHVGSVNSVELLTDRKIMVRFEVLEEFHKRVRSDSSVQIFRPFILAEKIIEISVGSEAAELIPVGGEIPVVASYDIMDLLSGKKMATLMNSFDQLAESLHIIGKAFSDPERSKSLVQMFDRLGPLVNNVNKMSVEFGKLASTANKDKRIDTIIGGLAAVTLELEKAMPAFNKEAPEVGKQMGQIVTNLNILTTEFQKLTPAISVLAPELPRTTHKAVEALDEAVVLLKALQKSFLFRGGVKEVLEEEKRQPASDK